MRWTFCIGLFVTILSENVAVADEGQSSETVKISEMTVPVLDGDSDKPYRVIGDIRANLRKHFAFQANPSKEKIYAEIWERGRKMGADAVINARFGKTIRTLFNHGSTPIFGTAIKYTDPIVPK